MSNIEHFKGGVTLGIITPNTKAWRDLTIDFERQQASHYERRLKKVTFHPVPRR